MNEKMAIVAGQQRILLGASGGMPAVLELTGAAGYYLDWICWEASTDGKLEICYGPLPDYGVTSPAMVGMFLQSSARVGGVFSSSTDISVSGWKVATMTTEELAQDSRYIRWKPDRNIGVVGIAMKWLSA